MFDWQDMSHYVGFTDQDRANLNALLPFVEPEFPRIVDNFYRAVLSSPARLVLQDPAQVERLKITLKQWIRELLSGPYDQVYWERRSRIGWTHVKVGLPHRYVFTAMNIFRQDLLEVTFANFCNEKGKEIGTSISKIADMELAVMSATYMDAHEDLQLRSLQDIIIRSMPVTILCLDADGRVTAATRPSARLFGEQAEIGRHYQDFLPDELLEASDLPSHLGRALANDEEINIPRIALGSGGDTRTFRISMVPLHHELARLLVHVEETTDVVQAEARAHQAEGLARIGVLAANVAHEIRNPLTAISATLQVISRSFPNDDRRKPILDKVGEQVIRLDRLVSDLLGYSRKAVPSLKPLQTLDVAREAIQAAGVAAELDVVCNGKIQADSQFLVQVLVNLLQNAADAVGPEGQIRMVVEGNSLAVVDNGPGVAPEIAERLFEPFVTSKTRGTGLGLAISRKLADSMGARLRYSPGEPGAVFKVSFDAR